MCDCLVAHNEFKALNLADIIKTLFKNSNDNEKFLIDVKGLYNVMDLKEWGIRFWRIIIYEKKKEITICLASSSGGHFEQLMMHVIEKYSGYVA